MSGDERAVREGERTSLAGEAVREERAMPATATAPPSVTPLPEEVWSAPEPWPSTLWRATKSAFLGGAGFYSLMRLMGENVTIPHAAFMGAWSAVMTVSMNRKGSLTPAAPALILGGVAVGGSLLVAGTELATGTGPADAAGIAAVGMFLGGVLIWMGLRARRAERELATSKQAGRVAPVLIPRAELASRVEAVRQENEVEAKRFMKKLTIGMVAFLGIFAFPYVRVFGAEPPDIVGFAAFFGMWGAFGLLARSASRRGREIAERTGLVCSACHQSYFGAFANMRLQKNLAEIGRCPNCGARIVTED